MANPAKRKPGVAGSVYCVYSYSPFVCITWACSPDLSCIFFPLLPLKPRGCVPRCLGVKCLLSFLGFPMCSSLLTIFLPGTVKFIGGKQCFYSALPRRLASRRCSIFSINAWSFIIWLLFSETSSAKERLRGFLIVSPSLITILTVIMPGNGFNYYNFLKI